MGGYLEKATFICGHRKGGTTLLLCLLDNHPQLLVYPPDSAFFYGYYPTYADTDHTDQERIDRVAGFIADQLENEIQKLKPEDQKALDFNMTGFREDIRSFASEKETTPGNLLESVFRAYRNHFDGSMTPLRWVEKTTSTEIYAGEVIKWFPKAKFVHLVRDPRDNWASLKSGWQKRYQNFNDTPERLLQSMIDRGRLGLEFAMANSERFGDNVYKVFRFEDLVNFPREILGHICEFLGVEFSEEIMKPTVCGKIWKGNNFDGLEFERPSSVNVGRWSERITEYEASLIEFHFREVMDHFGYERSKSIEDCCDAATSHYKWYNFSQAYSQLTRKDGQASK